MSKTVANGITNFMRFGPCTKLLKNGEEYLDDLVLNISKIKTITPKKVKVTNMWQGEYRHRDVEGALIETISGERFQFPPTNIRINNLRTLTRRLYLNHFFTDLVESVQMANKNGFADISGWYC